MDQDEPVSSSRNPFGASFSTATATATATSTTTTAPPVQHQAATSQRSNSITSSAPGSPTSTRTFSSFLSRATSVTTSSVTDRLGGAVGSVKSAVGSISSQLQQVPNLASTNIERFSGNVTSSINQLAATSSNPFDSPTATTQQPNNATTIINRTTNFGGGSTNGQSAIPKQQTLFVIDGYHTDWAKYFKKVQQKSTFSSVGATSSALFSSFSSSSDSTGSNISELIVEQADFREISVVSNSCLANEPTAIYLNSSRSHKSSRVVKPDYVLVRQRTKDRLDHFKNIVIGLNYGLLPMLESADLWHIFQDKSWTFSHLSQIQQRLGRDKFPLINQIYCQSHLELVQQINNGTITYPCLIRIGPSGRGKIKVDSGQMLLELASIVAMNKAACTIEPFVDAGCDLLVQKIGAKCMKAYMRRTGQITASDQPIITRRTSWNKHHLQQQQQQATGVGSSILATLQSTAGGSFNQAFGAGQQQTNTGNAIRQQPLVNYEPVQLTERYRRWIEAVDEHFKSRGGLEMFSIKALINNVEDKDYIIGISDCSMDLVSDNLDEDRRTVAELVIGHMNQLLDSKNRAVSQLESIATNGNLMTSNSGVTAVTDILDMERTTTSNRVPSLTGRSQSVSVGSDAILTRPPLPRRGSREPATDATKDFKRAADYQPKPINLSGSQTILAGAPDQTGGQAGVKPTSVTSFMDQTQSAAASAISSFQSKSMNFFRRLDSRQESFSSLLGSSSTSGSQDKLSGLGVDSVEEPFVSVAPMSAVSQPTTTTATVVTTGPSVPPPKPPPPVNRALSATSSNSILTNSQSVTDDRQSLINQNSDLAKSTMQQQQQQLQQQQNGQFDSQQQQNTEANPDDTMKNLRKTFAGIFGDI